jgi:hypothetical protein
MIPFFYTLQTGRATYLLNASILRRPPVSNVKITKNYVSRTRVLFEYFKLMLWLFHAAHKCRYLYGENPI